MLAIVVQHGGVRLADRADPLFSEPSHERPPTPLEIFCDGADRRPQHRVGGPSGLIHGRVEIHRAVHQPLQRIAELWRGAAEIDAGAGRRLAGCRIEAPGLAAEPGHAPVVRGVRNIDIRYHEHVGCEVDDAGRLVLRCGVGEHRHMSSLLFSSWITASMSAGVTAARARLTSGSGTWRSRSSNAATWRA